MKHSWIVLVAGCVPLVGVACGSNTDAGAPKPAAPVEVRIEATDFHFDLPGSVDAGEVRFVLENVGEYPHQAIIFRLRDGVTYDQFKDAVMNDQERMPELAQTVRGLSIIDPGVVQHPAEEELEPASYAVACFVHIGTEPRNHGQYGMVEPFEVR